MIGVLIGKGLCRLGIHRVNAWTYRCDGRCTQDGVCRLCKGRRVRERHDRIGNSWGGLWCGRCGADWSN